MVETNKEVTLTVSEKIEAHFAGIVTHDISISEQNAHNILVSKVKKLTRDMIKYQIIRIRRLYNE